MNSERPNNVSASGRSSPSSRLHGRARKYEPYSGEPFRRDDGAPNTQNHAPKHKQGVNTSHSFRGKRDWHSNGGKGGSSNIRKNGNGENSPNALCWVPKKSSFVPALRSAQDKKSSLLPTQNADEKASGINSNQVGSKVGGIATTTSDEFTPKVKSANLKDASCLTSDCASDNSSACELPTRNADERTSDQVRGEVGGDATTSHDFAHKVKIADPKDAPCSTSKSASDNWSPCDLHTGNDDERTSDINRNQVGVEVGENALTSHEYEQKMKISNLKGACCLTSKGDNGNWLACELVSRNADEKTSDINSNQVRGEVGRSALTLHESAQKVKVTELKDAPCLTSKCASDNRSACDSYPPYGHLSSGDYARDNETLRSVHLPVFEPFDIFSCKSGSPVMLKPSLLTINKAKRSEVKHAIQGLKGNILRPGMVLLKSYLSRNDQVTIVGKCRDLGIGPGGFYQPGYRDGAKLHLKMMCLGKNWDPETSQYGEICPADGAKPPAIPDEFYQLVRKSIQDSHVLIGKDMKPGSVEENLPWMTPDICLVNFYTTSGRLGLHQDRDESPESLDRRLPVVSFSIGDSAEFLYGDERNVEKAQKIVMESGDVLIFGGESRHIFHGVAAIIPNTAPNFLREETNFRPGRLNLTFREY